MGRKITPEEFEGAQQLRIEADEFFTDLFREVNIMFNLARFENGVGLSARIIGDTAPHPLNVIVECLGGLGVKHLSMVDPLTRNATQIPIGRDLGV